MRSRLRQQRKLLRKVVQTLDISGKTLVTDFPMYGGFYELNMEFHMESYESSLVKT
jgi:hypothetical protein